MVISKKTLALLISHDTMLPDIRNRFHIMEKRNAVPVRSVQKALEILDMLIFEDPACDGVSLSEIARRMAMPANSAHNLLKSMVVCNYVNQNERGHYIAGTMVEQIGSLNRLRSPRMMDVVVSCCRST